MEKIPTLFERRFDGHKIVDITDKITPGCEEAFLNGVATVKLDGSCCAIIDGVFYKRYDAKKGKQPPKGAIPCCDPDSVTGHHPHWVKVDFDDPANKWLVHAYHNARLFKNMIKYPIDKKDLEDGTYEAIGPHFQSNPHGYRLDIIKRHGKIIVKVDRDFDSIKNYLEEHEIEGLVFWLNNKPVCKIKRTDFGFSWNRK